MTSKREVEKLDPVSDDKNWRDRVATELRCNQEWVNNWGFFQGGKDIDMENANKSYSIEERIKMVQEQIDSLDVKEGDFCSQMKSTYAPKENIETFFVKENNRQLQEHLKAVDRKPKKGWEAEKKKYKFPKEDKK